MNEKKIKVIGDLINNAYGRARKAWTTRNLEGYQKLAKSQEEDGAIALDVNIDGTQVVSVKQEEMLEFLPELIPALQEATSVPLCFDNPSVKYHRMALKHHDQSKSNGKPIINSIAASRENLDEILELIKEYDTRVIVMASEHFLEDGGSAQCMNPNDSHAATKHFVELLTTKAGRTIDDIIVDTGLAPIGADTYCLVNIGLDAIKLINEDPDLQGIHFSVGLTNFAWGSPKAIRHQMERAYLRIASEVGLDYALANPEKDPQPSDPSDPLVDQLRNVLKIGRQQEGESREDAGFRQAEAVLEICLEHIDRD
ncbi:MAG: dihydropteroate synthase [Opitutaceae bacterium]|nr:dihydropteroate synthase [Opitutaceae bacterium]